MTVFFNVTFLTVMQHVHSILETRHNGTNCSFHVLIHC